MNNRISPNKPAKRTTKRKNRRSLLKFHKKRRGQFSSHSNNKNNYCLESVLKKMNYLKINLQKAKNKRQNNLRLRLFNKLKKLLPLLFSAKRQHLKTKKAKRNKVVFIKKALLNKKMRKKGTKKKKRNTREKRNIRNKRNKRKKRKKLFQVSLRNKLKTS